MYKRQGYDEGGRPTDVAKIVYTLTDADYDGFVMSEGAFAQLEYNRDKLSAFVSGGLSNTGYWRYDRMYYSCLLYTSCL